MNVRSPDQIQQADKSKDALISNIIDLNKSIGQKKSIDDLNNSIAEKNKSIDEEMISISALHDRVVVKVSKIHEIQDSCLVEGYDVNVMAHWNAQIAILNINIEEINDSVGRKQSLVTSTKSEISIIEKQITQIEGQINHIYEEINQLNDQIKLIRQDIVNLSKTFNDDVTNSDADVDSLTTSVSKMVIVLSHQDSVSSFVKPKTVALGLGFLPSSFKIDPNVERSIYSKLVPQLTQQSNMEIFIFPLRGKKVNLSCRMEDEPDGVRTFSVYSAPGLSNLYNNNEKKSLKH